MNKDNTPKPLTREKFLEITEELPNPFEDTDIADKLEELGYLAKPEPKKLTAKEACEVIGRGGRVRDKDNVSFPYENGFVSVDSDYEPYCEVEVE